MPTLTFKVTPEEAARIRRLARGESRSVSDFLRRRAMGALAATPDPSRYRIEISRITGLPVMRAPQGVPAVSPERVRALLADFP